MNYSLEQAQNSISIHIDSPANTLVVNQARPAANDAKKLRLRELQNKMCMVRKGCLVCYAITATGFSLSVYGATSLFKSHLNGQGAFVVAAGLVAVCVTIAVRRAVRWAAKELTTQMFFECHFTHFKTKLDRLIF